MRRVAGTFVLRTTALALLLPASIAAAQTADPDPPSAVAAPAGPPPVSHRPFGRIAFTVDVWQHRSDDGARRQVELGTAINVETPDFDGRGVEYGLNLRQSSRPGSDTQRLSVYDGFAGARLGPGGQLRLRAGHMWLPDLGTVGALAGGLVEFRQRPAVTNGSRIRAGAFLGREPLVHDMGYAPNVEKAGAYVAFERGFMRRHVVGYARVRQGPVTERSVLAVTNFIPAGRSLFVYQAAEIDLSGPAGGAGKRGLSYFLANARATLGPRVELSGNYNRGRAIDARSLTDDIRNGRAVTQERIDGLLYQSSGGRVTVEVARNLRTYVGYWRDRNNRDDAVTGRLLIGGHAGNLLGSGFDVTVSSSRIERPFGPYHSQYASVGHAIGRAAYVSVDYARSLSVVRYHRSDGVMIETRPRLRRVTANGSFTLGRRYGLQAVCDVDRDDSSTQIRVLTGLSVRF